MRKLRLSNNPNTNPNQSSARASMLKATLSPKSGFTTSHSIVRSKHLEVTGNKSYLHTYSCCESETVVLYTTKVKSCLNVQGNLAQPCLSQIPSRYPATSRIYTHPAVAKLFCYSQVDYPRQLQSTFFVVFTPGSCLHFIHTYTQTTAVTSLFR